MFGLTGYKNWLLIGTIVILSIVLIIFIIKRSINYYYRMVHKRNIINLMVNGINDYQIRERLKKYLERRVNVTDVTFLKDDSPFRYFIHGITIEIDPGKGWEKKKLIMFGKLGPFEWSYYKTGIPLDDKSKGCVSSYLSKRLEPKDVIPIGASVSMDPYERDEVVPPNLKPPIQDKDTDLGSQIWEMLDRIPGAPSDPLPFIDKFM